MRLSCPTINIGRTRGAHTRRHRLRSFSVAEAAIAVVVVGVMLVAALNMVAMSARARTVNAQLGKGPALAHAMLSEVLQAFYEEPDVTVIPIEGPEIELASHDPPGGNSGDFVIRGNDWAAQYFQPTLPTDALSWSVTRATFKAKAGGPKNGVAGVQIREADGSNAPSTNILEEHPLDESTLGTSYVWQDYTFTSVSNRPVGTGLILAIAAQVNDAEICKIEIEDATGAGPGFFESHDAGVPWTSRGGTAMYYHVFGKVTSPQVGSISIGPDTDEGTSTRTDFDDVDDYHGWSTSPPQERDGTTLPDYTGWTRSVSVDYINPTQPWGMSTMGDNGAKRITVIVTDPRGAQTNVVGIRTNLGAHEQEVSATKTYVNWVGLDLQIGEANAALSLGAAMANEPLAN